MDLSGKERADLRAEAHHLTATVHVGQQGMSPTVIQSLDDALRTHELVKVQLGRTADISAREAAGTLAEGMKLAKGQVIGYVGTTGNAPRNEPHLHFQVMRASDGRRWWDGTPVDPRPYFANPGTTPWTCRERSAPTCARRPTT